MLDYRAVLLPNEHIFKDFIQDEPFFFFFFFSESSMALEGLGVECSGAAGH